MAMLYVGAMAAGLFHGHFPEDAAEGGRDNDCFILDEN